MNLAYRHKLQSPKLHEDVVKEEKIVQSFKKEPTQHEFYEQKTRSFC